MKGYNHNKQPKGSGLAVALFVCVECSITARNDRYLRCG